MPQKRSRAQLKKFMEQARARFKSGTEGAQQKQRERIKEDLRFMVDQWPSEIRSARSGQLANNGLPALPARPCLQIDKISAPIGQVLNEQRQADLAPQLVPADDFGELGIAIDDTEIELREGLLRKALRESEAADAFSWGFSRAVQAGEGFFAVRTRYLSGRTFDQEIYFDRIFDQASVVIDPAHEQPDGSDSTWGFEGSIMPYDEYEAKYGELADGKDNPNAGLTDDEFRAVGSEAPDWFTTDKQDSKVHYVRVTNYWWTEYTTIEYVQLTTGEVVDRRAVPSDAMIAVDEDGNEIARTDVERTIRAATIDGLNILEETDFPAPWIPIVKILGVEMHPFDGQRWIQGMVRPARGAQEGFNAMVSSQVERVALSPLAPFQLAEGQDEGYEDEWKLVNTRTLPVVHYRQRDLEGNPAQPPMRVNGDANIQAISQSVALFDQSIKSTTAVPDPTLGNVDPSLRSGSAVKALVAQSQRSTSHYMDNLVRSLRHGARIFNALAPIVFGRHGRIVQIMTGNNELAKRTLGQAMQGGKQLTLSKGADFNIAIKVTKNADTRRQEENALIGELISSDPQAMLPVIGDLWFETMDSPGHKAMAQRWKAVLAPPIQAMLNGQQPIPPEVQQKMQALDQLNQELTRHVNDLTEQIKSKQIEGHTALIKAAQDNATRLDIAKIQAGATMAVADVKASVQQIVESAKAEAEQLRLIIETAQEERLQTQQHLHEAALTGAAQHHEAAMSGVEHTHDRIAAQHDAALEMATISHEAKVMPKPTSNGDSNVG